MQNILIVNSDQYAVVRLLGSLHSWQVAVNDKNTETFGLKEWATEFQVEFF